MNNYTFGFSLTGLTLYVLQLLPNLIWLLVPPANNILAKNSAIWPALNMLEKVCGILTVALLILLINKGGQRNSNFYLGLAMIFLLGYYLAWIFYYKGIVSPLVLIVGIAAMPPLYFLLVGVWLRNYVALIPGVVFGVVHVVITCLNFLKP